VSEVDTSRLFASMQNAIVRKLHVLFRVISPKIAVGDNTKLVCDKSNALIYSYSMHYLHHRKLFLPTISLLDLRDWRQNHPTKLFQCIRGSYFRYNGCIMEVSGMFAPLSENELKTLSRRTSARRRSRT
jgi:hypothetical protein